MTVPHAGKPCWCVGMKTIRCQCKCHISKSKKSILKAELKAQKKKG